VRKVRTPAASKALREKKQSLPRLQSEVHTWAH